MYNNKKFLRKVASPIKEKLFMALDEFWLNKEEAKDKMQTAILTEMDDYIKEQTEKNNKVIKNGTYSKKIYTLHGLLDLKIPRLKTKGFESKILNKFSRASKDFINLINLLLHFYLSYESIIDFLYDITDIKIGHSMISKIAKMREQEFLASQKEPIDNDIKYLFRDCFKVVGETKKARIKPCF